MILRLFLGIGLPSAYQKRLRPFTDALDTKLDSRVRWTPPGNWHLTLKFLGKTDDNRVPAITDALAAIKFPSFTLQAGGAGVFPRVQHPMVFWLGLRRGAGHCADLAAAIEDALDAIDIKREKKQFRPHLTLGRVKKPARDDWKSILETACEMQWPAFPVDHFTLWKSDLQPTGAVHTVLHEFPLI